MKPANFRWDYGDLLGSGVAVVVDRLMSSRTWKQPVVAATTANVDLTTDLEAGDVVDGVTLAEGDRVLVWRQTDPTENGVYDVSDTGAASRSSDFDSSVEIVGAFVLVLGGTVGAGKLYQDTNTVPITLGVDDITFVEFAPSSATGVGMVPYYIPPGDTFTVPLYRQALFSDTIEVDGILVVLGRLNGVD